MANYYHGVSTRQVDTSVSTPVEADSGIAFVVGAAPVHTVGGPVNEPVMCYTYQEAVSAFWVLRRLGEIPALRNDLFAIPAIRRCPRGAGECA